LLVSELSVESDRNIMTTFCSDIKPQLMEVSAGSIQVKRSSRDWISPFWFENNMNL